MDTLKHNNLLKELTIQKKHALLGLGLFYATLLWKGVMPSNFEYLLILITIVFLTVFVSITKAPIKEVQKQMLEKREYLLRKSMILSSSLHYIYLGLFKGFSYCAGAGYAVYSSSLKKTSFSSKNNASYWLNSVENSITVAQSKKNQVHNVGYKNKGVVAQITGNI